MNYTNEQVARISEKYSGNSPIGIIRDEDFEPLSKVSGSKSPQAYTQLYQQIAAKEYS